MLTPDVTATNYESKYYLEIAIQPTDKNEIQELISKWKVLNLVAEHKGINCICLLQEEISVLYKKQLISMDLMLHLYL